MATENTKEKKELTVEERLKAVYDLQTLLSEIDRIKTLRGELPLEVKDLEDDIEGLKTRIAKFKEEAEELRKSVSAKKIEIQQAQAEIAKYSEQQNNVRNNKEFDFLAKEIGYKQLEIELCEKRIREYSEQADRKLQDVAAAESNLDDKMHILEEKLRVRAKEVEADIEPRLLKAFKRIRSNARNGLGIVTIQRGACGGCFNRIPAQRQMEIKMHKKIIVCEYCGRIMIDPELAGEPEMV